MSGKWSAAVCYITAPPCRASTGFIPVGPRLVSYHHAAVRLVGLPPDLFRWGPVNWSALPSRRGPPCRASTGFIPVGPQLVSYITQRSALSGFTGFIPVVCCHTGSARGSCCLRLAEYSTLAQPVPPDRLVLTLTPWAHHHIGGFFATASRRGPYRPGQSPCCLPTSGSADSVLSPPGLRERAE